MSSKLHPAGKEGGDGNSGNQTDATNFVKDAWCKGNTIHRSLHGH